MQANKIWILLVFLFLLFVGCDKQEMTPFEYAQHIKSEESGMLKERVVNEFRFKLLYESLDYKVVNQLKTEEVDEAVYEELITNMEGMQYYVLKIDVVESAESILKYMLESEEDYQNRLSYFSFGFQNAIYIEENEEYIPCQLFHFERAYDLSPERTFVLGFEQKEATKFDDKTVVIDSDFFGTGKVKIKIEGEKIKSLPELIIKE